MEFSGGRSSRRAAEEDDLYASASRSGTSDPGGGKGRGVLCGTFGCTLPNNHRGLHRLPQQEEPGRRKRAKMEAADKSGGGDGPDDPDADSEMRSDPAEPDDQEDVCPEVETTKAADPTPHPHSHPDLPPLTLTLALTLALSLTLILARPRLPKPPTRPYPTRWPSMAHA